MPVVMSAHKPKAVNAPDVGLWLGTDPAGRASQFPEWDDEQTFGLPIMGARAQVYGNHWFSVHADHIVISRT